jgi:hypothetical protein
MTFLLIGVLAADSTAPTLVVSRGSFFLCSRGELSTSQAARLAGMTYGDFFGAAARARVVLFPVNLEELKEEPTRGFTLGRQRFAHRSTGEGGVR